MVKDTDFEHDYRGKIASINLGHNVIYVGIGIGLFLQWIFTVFSNLWLTGTDLAVIAWMRDIANLAILIPCFLWWAYGHQHYVVIKSKLRLNPIKINQPTCRSKMEYNLVALSVIAIGYSALLLNVINGAPATRCQNIDESNQALIAEQCSSYIIKH